MSVELGQRSYDVLIAFDRLSELGPVLREEAPVRDNVAVITSPRVGGLYFGALEAGLRAGGFEHLGRWDLPDGEENKNLANFVAAARWLARFTPDPSVLPAVVALGGGVVGDLAGFAAATFRRGVPYVQVPTTLLAAVDSSVGGKTAVNLPEGKNLVGAFYQPALVFADLATLQTLEERELRSGVAEVIKYGIALDAAFFEFLEGCVEELLALDREVLARVVRRCIELKADVVRQDERDDRGVRICLNFGHTLGHAIEKASRARLRHGECVAVGMIAAAHISVRCGLCAPEVRDRLTDALSRAGLPTHVEGIDPGHVLELMQHDKKFVSGRNRFVLLTGVGEWTEYEGVPREVITEAARAVLA